MFHIRYRAKNRLFRKPLVVLQVGENKNTGFDDETTPPSNQNKDYIQWRDATMEDLLMLRMQ